LLTAEVQEDQWVTVKLDFLRQLKTPDEIKLITVAVKIADDAFEAVLPHFVPGACERHLAALLEYEMRKRGADKAAFDTIVASGSRSALPHGVASDKLLETGDFVVVDFGAVFRGYNSDMTRTLCMGKASDKQRKVYETVLTAQLAGIAAVLAGAECVQVDRAARQVIDNAGYGEFFGHGLGHGVGIMIHEEPKLSAGASDDKLAETMVVTVEPGIYLPDWGGVRIEDLVVVNQDVCSILTRTGKTLLEVM